MGEFIAPKHKVVDFAEVRSGFTPALPLILRELTGQIVAFFRSLMNGTTEYEAMVFLYWDRQEEEFVVYVPKQTASKACMFLRRFEFGFKSLGRRSARCIT